MPAAKVTILLADEDALRRDGLSAVLSGTDNLVVVSSVADGDTALDQMRNKHPDVAIVDLNLPRVHGIELIRRVRAENLNTRVVILAGTTDDEIIREVVRAGGDGYLLKNGPSRHLLDAISYVRDGGQYFSPQLRRDGRTRHLLEEPPREPAQAQRAPDHEVDEEPEEDSYREPSRRPRSSSYRGRRGGRRGEIVPLRDRIREQGGSGNLDDRDYEIMNMMADGIRPILDRLDEIDNRVAQMEEGAEPVPSNPRGWLTRQLADTLDVRGGDLTTSRTAGELEARLPEMIEEAVTRRFNQMAGKLQEQIEESHVKTLETFVKNIQVKLVQRVSALEQDMGKQAEAMQQLREYSLRTEDNLSRLISGVDKLAKELPQKLAQARQDEEAERARNEAARAETWSRNQRPEPPEQDPPADTATSFVSTPPPPRKPLRRVQPQPPKKKLNLKVLGGVIGGIVALGLSIWGIIFFANRPSDSHAASTTASNAPAAAKITPPAATADTKTKMASAQQYVDNKDYAMAEDIYKQVVAVEPNNIDALKALASVLYREDKIDESAAILDRIPKN